jgi:hypothetical protein
LETKVEKFENTKMFIFSLKANMSQLKKKPDYSRDVQVEIFKNFETNSKTKVTLTNNKFKIEVNILLATIHSWMPL